MSGRWYRAVLFLLVLGGMMGARPAQAAAGESRIGFYSESPLEWLALRSVTAHTVVEGPLARTWVTYVLKNDFAVDTEVGFNLHVPNDTVLTEFGYYYKGRYIRGRMYDNEEAWKIYQAVTSRGRDPGIMDRPTRQDYHAQIFPVEPHHDLQVVIELVQVVASDQEGFHVEVPIAVTPPGSAFDVAPDPKGVHIVLPAIPQDGGSEAPVDALVEVKGIAASQLYGSLPVSHQALPGGAAYSIPGGAALHLKARMKPGGSWVITIHRKAPRTVVQSYSALGRDGRGYFALMLSPAHDLHNVAVTLGGDTFQSLPTRLGDVQAWDRVCVVGMYQPGRRLSATFRQGTQPVIHAVEPLSSHQAAGPRNMASRMWAAKRIDALQGSGRDVRTQVVYLSKRFNVVSDYTALLAIPHEELEYYQKVLAKRQIATNTESVGGGGGDPYITVKAPADAQQVVAVFPTGETRSLAYNAQTEAWETRFDIPYGAPAGEYRVTVIVVHRDGSRSTFILVYENLLTSAATGAGGPMQAEPGKPVRVKVTGRGIARAIAVAPWGERANLQGAGGVWDATLTVPQDWPAGDAPVQIVLLDGAHNRTEITLTLNVRAKG